MTSENIIGNDDNKEHATVLFPLSEDFFKEETRCGYTVSAKMKRIWAKELDLLRVFADVCEKNDLEYFLDGGTLLGAIRHKGFIPWDDDVDVIMPRKDYDRLWEIADACFEYPYFFQTSLSEKNFFRAHAQLRNSETTGFIQSDEKKDINKGIFLDIFPLDNVPSDKIEREQLKNKTAKYKRILSFAYDRDPDELNFPKRCANTLLRAVISPQKKFVKFNRLLSMYKDAETDEVGDISLDWRESVIWDKELYDGFCYMQFENLSLRAPSGYDKIMTKQYGDYMKLPDDINAKNGRSHGGVTFEPDMPYKEYFRMINAEQTDKTNNEQE